jgi:hypothetical protein
MKVEDCFAAAQSAVIKLCLPAEVEDGMGWVRGVGSGYWEVGC